MSYVVYGDFNAQYKFTNPQDWDYVEQHGTFMTAENNVAFGIWLKEHDSSKPLGTTNFDEYIIYVKQISGDTKLTNVPWTVTTDRIKDGVVKNTYSQKYGITIDESKGYGSQTLIKNYEQYFDATKLYNYFNLTTGIPIFKSEQSVLHYLDTGDTSDSIKYLNTDWTLYIDGKSNPLYKLAWKCDGLKDIDTSFTTISIWVGTYNVLDDTFNDDDGAKFKDVDYEITNISYSSIFT